MTPRENLLAVLSHRQGEWVPCSPHILGVNNLPGQLPASYLQGSLDRLAISRYVGGTVLYELSGARPRRADDITVDTENDGELIHTTTRTPLGLLRATKQRSRIPTPEYPLVSGLVLPGPLEADTQTVHAIQALSDYETLAYILDNTNYHPDRAAVQAARSAVGEDGAVVCGASCSPLYALVSHWAGLERTVYDLADEPETVEKAMEAMFWAGMRHLEAVCDTDCDIVRITEDLDTSLVSPAMFERYAYPTLKAYVDRCHELGKLVVLHMCGRIRGLLPILRRVGPDAIHCLCPPETGDTTMAEARAIFGQAVAIMARVDPPRLLEETPEALEELVSSMIQEAGGGADNFMVILPCGRASLANLRAVIRAAEGTRF